MIQQKWLTQKLKILAGRAPFQDMKGFEDIRGRVARYLQHINCPYADAYWITDPKSGFRYQFILNVDLGGLNRQTQESLDQAVELFASQFHDLLGSSVLKYLWTNESSYKTLEFDCVNKPIKLITSYYSWAEDVDPVQRERYMWEHFVLERRQEAYASVHFNGVVDRKWNANERYGFAFESYLINEAEIEKVYKSPLLEEMREHSKGFLNTDTRKLAFGECIRIQRTE